MRKKKRQKKSYQRERERENLKKGGINTTNQEFIKNPNILVIAILLITSVTRQRSSMAFKEYLAICYFKRH